MEFKKSLKEAGLKNKIEYINIISNNSNNNYNSAIVALLPYYAGDDKSYLSKYTRGCDYHILGKKIMEKILNDLSVSDYEIYVDISPYNEKELALFAGLGILGRNGLVINEKYGSYVFILTAFINRDEYYEKQNIRRCPDCGLCISACPNGALGEDFCKEKCVSFISQKRHITEAEENLLREVKSAWGCDICQDICPMNRNAAFTPFFELRDNLLFEIEDIDTLSNKEFKDKYKNFSLAYRGKKVIQRNINIITKN